MQYSFDSRVSSDRNIAGCLSFSQGWEKGFTEYAGYE